MILYNLQQPGSLVLQLLLFHLRDLSSQAGSQRALRPVIFPLLQLSLKGCAAYWRDRSPRLTQSQTKTPFPPFSARISCPFSAVLRPGPASLCRETFD